MGLNRSIAMVAALVFLAAPSTRGQNQVKLSGLFYMDYEYVAASPDSSLEGTNGFRYRRLYLTSDFLLSEKFSGRARLEAETGRLTEGRPFAFVKDLWLKWKNMLGEGHNGIFGVQPPPVYAISEKVWGYRSLEKTIMDRNAVVVSRDFGAQLTGTFGKDSPLGYGVMVGNNSGVIGETDKSKRVYGQLSYITEGGVTVTLESDYAASPDRNAINTSGFAAYDAGVARVGVEGYYRVIENASQDENDTNRGLSVWVVAQASETVEVIGRVDRVDREILGNQLDETYGLLGVAFIPERHVRFIPNVWISKFNDRDATVVGRVTLHADF